MDAPTAPTEFALRRSSYIAEIKSYAVNRSEPKGGHRVWLLKIFNAFGRATKINGAKAVVLDRKHVLTYLETAYYYRGLAHANGHSRSEMDPRWIKILYDVSLPFHIRASRHGPSYAITESDVVQCLRFYGVLSPSHVEAAASFPRFLDLPSELRLNILNFAAYSPPLQYDRGAREFWALARNPGAHPPLARSIYPILGGYPTLNNTAYYVGTTRSTIVNILLANSQIYNEYMKAFYNVNTFVFTSLWDLEQFLDVGQKLRSTSIDRKDLIRSLSVVHSRYMRKNVKAVFRKLSLLVQIRKFTIYLDYPGVFRSCHGIATLCDRLLARRPLAGDESKWDPHLALSSSVRLVSRPRAHIAPYRDAVLSSKATDPPSFSLSASCLLLICNAVPRSRLSFPMPSLISSPSFTL